MTPARIPPLPVSKAQRRPRQASREEERPGTVRILGTRPPTRQNCVIALRRPVAAHSPRAADSVRNLQSSCLIVSPKVNDLRAFRIGFFPISGRQNVT